MKAFREYIKYEKETIESEFIILNKNKIWEHMLPIYTCIIMLMSQPEM